MKRWYVGLARLAYWLACTSSLSMLWMALVYPPTHPRRLPPMPVQVVWWTLVLYAPVAVALGGVACLAIWFRPGSKPGLSHAQAAMAIGVIACCIILGNTEYQFQTRKDYTGSSGSCFSNEKQLTLCLRMYAQDYDDRFPIASSWNESTLPYIKYESVYRCPQEYVQSIASYGINRHLAQVKTERIVQPITTVLLIDAAPGVNRAVGKEDYPFTDRHEDHVNAAFTDGHIKSTKTQDLSKLLWEPYPAKTKR